MPLKLITKNPSELQIRRSQNLLKAVRNRISKGDLRSQGQVYQALFEAFRDFFTNIGAPSLKSDLLNPESIRNFEDILDRFKEIGIDLTVLFEELDRATQAAVTGFNGHAALNKTLDHRIQQITSKSLDVRVLSTDAVGQNIIVAGDDFNDLSRIDFARISGAPVEVPFNRGALSLKRQSTESVITEAAQVFVDAVGKDQSFRSEGVEITFRKAYEGRLFAYAGEAEPEGSSFHFAQTPFGGVPTTPGESVTVGAGNANTVKNPDLVTDPPQVYLVEGLQVEEERRLKRRRILDGNPDTFWQIERVIDLPFAFETGDSAPSPDKAQQRIRDWDQKSGKDFDVDLTIDLGEVRPINWINLNPFNFGAREWLEVMDLRAGIELGSLEQISHLNDNRFNTTLTSEANEALDDRTAAVTLSANRFKYTGQGVWAFPKRDARFIKFTLRQKVPLLIPYETLVIQLRREITASTERVSRSWFGLVKHPEFNQNTEARVRNIVLPYEMALQIFQGERTAEQLAQQVETKAVTGQATASGTKKSERMPVIGGTLVAAGGTLAATGAGLLVGGIVAGVGAIIAAWGGTKERTTVDDSGWYLNKFWNEVRLDKARFAVGIRDIDVFANTYEVSSELVSVPFRTPRPISRIVLKDVDESVPEDFNPPGVTPRRFIDYFVSVDNGNTWVPINPLSHSGLRNQDGDRVPKIIEVNSQLVEEERDTRKGYIDLDQEVQEVRFRALLRRPNGEEASFQTPLLNSYRLNMTMKEPL